MPPTCAQLSLSDRPLIKPTEICSILPKTPLTFRVTKAWQMRAGTATTRPNFVVIKASEIPPESIRGSPVPKTVIMLKVFIIPVTVPSNPRRGAVAAVRAISGIQRSRAGLALNIFSYMISSRYSFFSWRFSTADFKTSPT